MLYAYKICIINLWWQQSFNCHYRYSQSITAVWTRGGLVLMKQTWLIFFGFLISICTCYCLCLLECQNTLFVLARNISPDIKELCCHQSFSYQWRPGRTHKKQLEVWRIDTLSLAHVCVGSKKDILLWGHFEILAPGSLKLFTTFSTLASILLAEYPAHFRNRVCNCRRTGTLWTLCSIPLASFVL